MNRHGRSRSPGYRRNNDRFSDRRNDYKPSSYDSFSRQPRFNDERRRNNKDINNDMVIVADDGRIDFTDCYLKPPRVVWAPRRQKPPGSRTIYVGGFPDLLMSESNRLLDIVREVFTLNGGEIESIRKNNKGFFHVQFVSEECVDAAIKVLGYHMVIRNICDKSEISFPLKVDFSETREDLHDLRSTEILKKSIKVSGSSISNTASFCDADVKGVIDSFKEPEKFQDSVIVVRGWINSNLISKENSSAIFTMLQASYFQVKDLLEQKKQLNDEYNTVQSRYHENVIRLRKGFNNLILLYEDAHKQSAWDKFTRPQRKSIDTWLNQAKDGLSANKKLEIPDEKEQFGREKTDSNNVDSIKRSLQQVQQQVWDLIGKLQTKDHHIKEKNDNIDILKNEINEKSGILAKRQAENHSVPKKDAKLLCALSSFLQLFPEGAFVNQIEQYLHENKIETNMEMVEVLFLKLPDLFELNVSLVDGKPCHKWSCKRT